MDPFRRRYGPWALVAGASVGIGAAFVETIAARGINVALVARRAEPLRSLAEHLAPAHRVEALAIQADLAEPAAPRSIADQLEDRQVGLLVYNAALSLVGPFLEQPLEAHLRELDINCRGPLSLAYAFGRQMAQRGRGGIILMSSLAGQQGSPFIANYAATRAYNIVLAEGLWAELAPRGVDVLACLAGAVATPGYADTAAARTSRFAPPPLDPRELAEETLRALGRGPTHVPGLANRWASYIMRRVLPRRMAIGLMARNTRGLSRSPTS